MPEFIEKTSETIADIIVRFAENEWLNDQTEHALVCTCV